MDKPILFSGEMVRAILDGRKTQTRRVVPEWQKPARTLDGKEFMSVAQRHPRWGFGVFGATEEECMDKYNDEYSSLCPYGKSGDQLWVRETWAARPEYDDTAPRHIPVGTKIYHAADRELGMLNCTKYRPSIFMPRWASRLTLEITGVRVERLQDISEEDAKAEGVSGEQEAAAAGFEWYDKPRRAFRFLWQSINGAESWNSNPWVWVVEFKPIIANIDQLKSAA